MNPDRTPAINMLTLVSRIEYPIALSTTATITRIENIMRKPLAETTVRTTAAIALPGTQPIAIHLTPFLSTVLRSRYASKTTSIIPFKMRGAGINSGSIRTRSGAANTARPNPIDPCTQEATATMVQAKIASKREIGSIRNLACLTSTITQWRSGTTLVLFDPEIPLTGDLVRFSFDTYLEWFNLNLWINGLGISIYRCVLKHLAYPVKFLRVTFQ